MKTISNRNELIKTLNKNLIVCEIGVFKGEFSKYLLDNLEPKELHLIDIFEGQMCSGDKDGNNIIWTELILEYENLKRVYSDNSKVTIHKGFSEQILEKFPDDYFDMIYVDGDHTYAGVQKDLKICFRKIKNGGILCGHDYSEFKFPGVFKAVNEFCRDNNQQIDTVTLDGCPTFQINLNKVN